MSDGPPLIEISAASKRYHGLRPLRLARLVVERERRNGRPVDTVRLQCWRITYARDTLEATSEMMREFTYEAAAAPAGR